MSELREISPRNERPVLLAALAERKMARLEDELEVWMAISGQMYESLPLTGDVTLKREVTDGSSGNPIEISFQTTNIGGGLAWYEIVTTTLDGRVVFKYDDGYGHSEGQPLSGFKRAVLAVKLLKGRPDHWDKETDFYRGD